MMEPAGYDMWDGTTGESMNMSPKIFAVNMLFLYY